MGLFTGTVENYRLFRSRVPSEIASLLVSKTRSETDRCKLLDLGTGTGFVIEALKHDFGEIIGVDSDPDMLAAARLDVKPLPSQSIQWVHARAEEYFPDSGWEPDLVTMSRAFHWFDREKVLANFDTFVAPEGLVAVMGDFSIWTSQQDWKLAMRTLVQSFLGEPRRAGDGFKQDDERPFREVLEQSSFSNIEEHTIHVASEREPASVIGYLHSTSFAAPRLFGSRLKEFDSAALELLEKYATNGVVTDQNTFGVFLARRSGNS